MAESLLVMVSHRTQLAFMAVFTCQKILTFRKPCPVPRRLNNGSNQKRGGGGILAKYLCQHNFQTYILIPRLRKVRS